MFETAHGIGEASGAGEFGDGGIADDFKVATSDGFTQQADGGQREDEVANRTATNDENAGRRVHQ